MAVAREQMTLEQFLVLPEQEPPLELMDGDVTQKVAPVTEHVVLQLQFRDLVDGFAWPRRLARAFPSCARATLQASTIPDVSVYTWDRLPRGQGGAWNNDVREPPDLAFEVLSPEPEPDRCPRSVSLVCRERGPNRDLRRSRPTACRCVPPPG